MDISAIIIAKNAEKTIGRCLKSLSFCREKIVVLDSHTTDNTASISRVFGARVIPQTWKGFGTQKNFGAEQAHGSWLLFIDDDEEVSVQLQKDILETIAKTKHGVVWIPILTIFLGKPLRHLTGNNPRLFRRNAARWTDSAVHEQVERSDGTRIVLGDLYSERLSSHLVHHSHSTIRSYLSSMHIYTKLDAKEMTKTGKHRLGKNASPSWYLPYYLAGKQLIKLLFYKKGALDGIRGIAWCILSSYYEYEMAIKYIRTSRLR